MNQRTPRPCPPPSTGDPSGVVVDRSAPAATERLEAEAVRRRDIATVLGGALGAFALSACASNVRVGDEPTRKTAEAWSNGAGTSGNAFLWVDTIAGPGANLRSVVGSDASGASTPVIVAGGYWAPGDGGGGLFYWNTATGTDNGGTIFVPGTGTRVGSTGPYWQRIYSNEINVRWFGAKGDGVSDDTAAINAAIRFIESAAPMGNNSTGNTVFVPAGMYVVNPPNATSAAILINNNNTCLIGAGGPPFGSSVIQVNASSGGQGTGTGILIENTNTTGTKAIAYMCQLRNLTIQGNAGNMPQDLVVVHSGQCSFVDCYFLWCTRFGLLIESGTVGSGGLLGVTLGAPGTYFLADFWRATNLQFSICGPWSTNATKNVLDGAALYVHGADTNGGVAVGCQAIDTNVSFGDHSEAGCTWVGCYSQNPHGLGYYSGPNMSSWYGCGSEDSTSANFEAGWGGVVVGAALATATTPSSPVYRVAAGNSSLSFGTIGMDGARYSANVPGAYSSALDISRGYTPWTAQTPFVAGNLVAPNPPNGFYYSCTTAGISGAHAPSFPTAPNATVSDGTVLWTCVGPTHGASQWSLAYHGLTTNYDNAPFLQNSLRWIHFQNGIIDTTLSSEYGAPFGWTDSDNVRGAGLPFIGNPLINSVARWSLKQSQDNFGVPITLFPGVNVITLNGHYTSAPNNVPASSAWTSDGWLSFATPMAAWWSKSQPRFSVSVEFPSVTTVAALAALPEVRVGGYAYLPTYDHSSPPNLIGWDLAVQVINTGTSNVTGARLTWHFELFVTNYDSGALGAHPAA